MKITLAKALKLKNKKVSNIGKLSERLRACNSYKEGNPPAYNSSTMLSQFVSETDSLIALKSAINKANVGINDSILRIAENKSKIMVLRGMDTKEGENIRGFGDMKTVDKYIATISERDRDNLVDALELEIEGLQDKIDHFNATTQIEI